MTFAVSSGSVITYEAARDARFIAKSARFIMLRVIHHDMNRYLCCACGNRRAKESLVKGKWLGI